MDVRPLSKKLQQKAEAELGEVPNRIPEDLDHIRKWIEKQKYLSCRTDDQWLVNFLRGCKYSLERTKEKLDNFYTVRSLAPEMFLNRDPLSPDLNEIIQSGICLALPNSIGETGARIIYWDWSKANIETMTLLNICKVIYMFFDLLLLEDDNFVISGLWLWSNCTNLQLNYMLQMTPPLAKKCATCVEECYPVRIKGMHYTNAPKISETIFNLVKTFASAKIKDRMSFIGANNIYKFEELLPQKYWPKELGGENGSLPEIRDYWTQKMEKHRDWFLEDEKYGTNENLRPDKPKTTAEIFGVEGAFRKLTID